MNNVFQFYQTLLWLVVSIRTIHAFSASSSKIKKKIVLPKAELINRRKSPALWREDSQPIRIEDEKKLSPLPVRMPEVMAPVSFWIDWFLVSTL